MVHTSTAYRYTSGSLCIGITLCALKKKKNLKEKESREGKKKEN